MSRPPSYPFDWIEPGEYQYDPTGIFLESGMGVKGKPDQLEFDRGWLAAWRFVNLPPLYWMRG